jgi:hypothetical protein
MIDNIMHRRQGGAALDLAQMHGGGYEIEAIVVLMKIGN